MSTELDRMFDALAQPFDPSEVKWKPQTVRGERAMACAYIDARCVMDRLDEVVGPDAWQDDYEVLADGACVCRLKVRLNGEWITKTDVGSESEQPDEHDRRKASFSDALKRAAVKLGIGRYLYRLPHQWIGYDPKTRRLVGDPQLPAWAVPGKRHGGAPVTTPQPAEPPTRTQLPTPPAPRQPPARGSIGERFMDRLVSKSNELEAAGLADPGELIEHIRLSGEEARFPEDLTHWTQAQISVAAGWVIQFEDQARKAKDAGQQRGERASLALPQADMSRLAQLLARKGVRLVDVAPRANIKANTLIDELTPQQAEALAAILGRMADAKE